RPACDLDQYDAVVGHRDRPFGESQPGCDRSKRHHRSFRAARIECYGRRMLTRINPMRTTVRCGVTLAMAGMLAACNSTSQTRPTTIDEMAAELARNSIIVDTHIDVPIRVAMTGDDVTQAITGGAFDYPRARAGGLDVAFMSIFIPASI